MYDLFAPYADGIAGGAGVPLSSTHFCLAQAAAAGDRLDLAVEHYQAALDIHHDLGWRAAAVETGRHYAAALARRDGPSDREHALALTQATLALGAEIGMPLAVRDSERLRAQLLGEIPAEPPAAPKSRRRDRARGLVTARGRATVAHWTRGKSDDELFRRFSAPMAQRALFAAMAHSFQPARADGLVATLTFELRPNDDDGDPAASDWWTVSIKADKATAKRGRPDRSTLVIHARWPDFVRLAAGEVHPVRALLENTVEVEGEVLLAGRLPELFGAIEL
jgi:hypothetical protein